MTNNFVNTTEIFVNARRVIVQTVLGRLIPLVLAMTLAITPMARAICEWSCADGIHGSSSTGSAHHAHGAPTPDHAADQQHPADSHPVATQAHTHPEGSVTTSIAPRCCAHADTHTASIAAAKVALEPPALTPAAFDLRDLLVFGASTTLVSPVVRPLPLSLRTLLRV